ncbi:CoA-binding protein, partial [bacterium]|nr:CoA-binding protein [bacterium]
MIKPLEENPLYRIANPRSIVFFGASNNMMSMGTMLLISTLEQGFKGMIYPVHLKEEIVKGIKAYKNVGDLPETPDLAIIVLPTGIVCPTLEECGKKGIKQAIIVSGGFKEVGGDGIALEKQVSSIADT